MMALVREFRLVPLVLLSVTCLFALKVVGLVLEGGYLFSHASPPAERIATVAAAPSPRPSARQSWAQQMFNFPDPGTTATVKRPQEKAVSLSDVTGSVDSKSQEKPAEPEAAAKKPVEPKPGVNGVIVPVENKPVSPAERAILERLHERREAIESRSRELDMRETLLKAAEQKLEARIGELKETETRIADAVQKKEETEHARLKGLVTMYENMKAKDAAKIFDRLDMGVLIDVASQINPRRMSDILAQMSPDVAQRLTIEFASRGNGAAQKPVAPAELPKIEGRPAN
ncbi:MAG: MotE family protein [Pseudorhodoplanes sp.]